MKAIVTGSNGFIGYNLCQELKARGWDVVGVDDLSAGLASNVVDCFRYEVAQVQDREAMTRLMAEFRPDTVFHLAAVPRVSYSVEHPTETAEANVQGTLSLLESIVKSGLGSQTRLVFSSSSSVYGGAELMPTPESQPLAPRSPYALQKAQSEQWLRLFPTLYGLDTVSLRYFNVFGPHALFGGAYSTVLTAWMYYLYVNDQVEPFLEGDGEQTRDFCSVENVVAANILAAIREEPFQGQAFNIAQGSATSLLRCRTMLEEMAGKPLPLAQRSQRVGDVKHTLADISAARCDLGYDPATDLVAQLQVMADWYATSYPESL